MQEQKVHPERDTGTESLRQNDVAGSPARGSGETPFSRERQNPYVQQVNALPLLTLREERAIAKQYAESRQFLCGLVNESPFLLYSIAERLLTQAADVRLANYFNLEDQDEDTDVRLFFCEKVPVVLQEFRYLQEQSHTVKSARSEAKKFLDALVPLIPRDTFYTLCLDEMDHCAQERPECFPRLSKLHKKVQEEREKMRKASDTLVERNLRLVISIAWRYTYSGIPLEDLVQEGNIGLVRSVERFDYTKGYCFSTYASYWIKQAISHHIVNHSRIIRLPANMIRILQQIRTLEQESMQNIGRPPSDEEMAERLGISQEKLRALRKMALQPVSLQNIPAEEGSLEEILPDPNAMQPSETAQNESLKESLLQILSQLNRREQKIIRMRFGLDGEEEHTLVQISQELGISSERVRQIEASALQKMRAPCKKQILGQDGIQ